MKEVRKTVLVPYEKYVGLSKGTPSIEKAVQTDELDWQRTKEDSSPQTTKLQIERQGSMKDRLIPPGIRSNKKKRLSKWISL